MENNYSSPYLKFEEVFTLEDVLKVNTFLEQKALEYKPVVLSEDEKQEDYLLELEKDWKVFTPHYNTSDYIDIFGKGEFLEVCKEKISELWQDDKLERKTYLKLIKFISKRASNPEGYTFCEQWLDSIIGEKINELESQLKRFSLLFNTLNQKKETLNHLSNDQIQRAREFPTYDLYSGQLRHISNRHSCLCPFHEEKTPSFVFYDDGSFYCFGCSAHGNNAIDYLIKKEKLEFREAVLRLC